jgi:predicted  nucleic acid-binding Zn-ribbon protein
VPTSRLYALQQADSALAEAVAQRAKLDDGAGRRTAVAEHVARIQDLTHSIAAAQSRQRALDLEIQSLRAKRTRLEADMYSGRIGNPKELAAMQEDAAAIGRHARHLEDEELGVMEELEGLEADRGQAQEALRAAEVDLARTAAEYERDAAVLDERIAHLTEQRRATAAEIDEGLLRRYDRLREGKQGIAVVAVRGGVCDGCHVTVPQRLRSRLERDADLVATCDGCGRLLVVLPGS